MLAFLIPPVGVCYSAHFGCETQRLGFPLQHPWQGRQECVSGFLLLFPGMCTAAGALGIRNARVTKAFAGPAVALVASSIFIHGAPRSIGWHFLCLWQVWLNGSIQSCAPNRSQCCGYPAPPRGSASHWLPSQLCCSWSSREGAALGTGRGRPCVTPLLTLPWYTGPACLPATMLQLRARGLGDGQLAKAPQLYPRHMLVEIHCPWQLELVLHLKQHWALYTAPTSAQSARE